MCAEKKTKQSTAFYRNEKKVFTRRTGNADDGAAAEQKT